uniref:Uncharacterized protein n=1 Tax=Staphylothermus marinus TaxID=2280 RepID=A0A7J3KER3_STAMA
MKKLDLPPRIKVLEAAGSIGDGRILKVSDEEFRVKSSDGSRTYLVIVKRIDDKSFAVYSNDNGTVYRGYIGYPIIAALIINGVLPIDNEVINALKGIPWRELNTRFKNYGIVENIVLNQCEKRGLSRTVVLDYINIVMKKIGVLTLYFDETLSKQ